MLVRVRNIEREVTVYKDRYGKITVKVGKARLYWRPGYEQPFIYIPDCGYKEICKARPLIMEFVNEYKRLKAINKIVAHATPLSFEGEGVKTPYKYQPQKDRVGYVSGFPAWITDQKIAQKCSGPIRGEYIRKVKIPQELKEQVVHYMTYCQRCEHRETCSGPCLLPESMSKEKLEVM